MPCNVPRVRLCAAETTTCIDITYWILGLIKECTYLCMPALAQQATGHCTIQLNWGLNANVAGMMFDWRDNDEHGKFGVGIRRTCHIED